MRSWHRWRRPRLFLLAWLIPVVLHSVFDASVFSLRLDAVTFWKRAIHALDFGDLMQGFTKPLVFGFILATVGCYKGLTVRGGTQGVGRATTQAVVVSSVLIIIADLFLTKIALFLANKLF